MNAETAPRSGPAPILALTGGSGFLGGHILDLAIARGFSVRALARKPAAAAALAARGAVPVLGDLADGLALAQLCAGADAVIHGAGLVRARNQAEFARANIAGAARMALAAREAGISRFVHISSLVAKAPRLSDYAASKFSGEEAVSRTFAGIDGGGLVILRPPAIYGPGDRDLAPLWAIAAHGFLPAPSFGEGVEARLAIVHVADAASAALAGLTAPAGRYSLHDGRAEGYSWTELATAASEALERRVRLLRVPRGALRAAGGLADLWTRLDGRPGTFGAGKVREMLHPDWTDPAHDFTRASAWRPQWDFVHGLRATVASPDR